MEKRVIENVGFWSCTRRFGSIPLRLPPENQEFFSDNLGLQNEKVPIGSGNVRFSFENVLFIPENPVFDTENVLEQGSLGVALHLLEKPAAKCDPRPLAKISGLKSTAERAQDLNASASALRTDRSRPLQSSVSSMPSVVKNPTA